MKLKNVAASVISGQVEGYGAILASMADVIAISRERGDKRMLSQ